MTLKANCGSSDIHCTTDTAGTFNTTFFANAVGVNAFTCYDGTAFIGTASTSDTADNSIKLLLLPLLVLVILLMRLLIESMKQS